MSQHNSAPDRRTADTSRRPNPHRSNADKARAAAMAAAGHDLAEICAALGIVRATARAWRKRDNWLTPQRITDNLPKTSPAGEQASATAPGNATAGDLVLIQHRAQLNTARRRIDELLVMPDLGAGDRGSLAQAADRVTCALERLHRLDRQAHGIAETVAGPSVAVIVVPGRSKDVAAWAASQGVKVQGVDGGPKRRKSAPARIVEDVDYDDLPPAPGDIASSADDDDAQPATELPFPTEASA